MLRIANSLLSQYALPALQPWSTEAVHTSARQIEDVFPASLRPQ
jgi:hypothetical protein